MSRTHCTRADIKFEIVARTPATRAPVGSVASLTRASYIGRQCARIARIRDCCVVGTEIDAERAGAMGFGVVGQLGRRSRCECAVGEDGG